MTDAELMRMAIEKAQDGIRHGQTPFGACIAKAGEPVVAAHNVVWATTDITAHAEIHAIRLACAKLKTIDLSGCVIYSTCEPCPMCMAACHWARLDRVVFGARIADAARAGFNELTLSNETIKELGHSPVLLTGDFMRDECRSLFDLWQAHGRKAVY